MVIVCMVCVIFIVVIIFSVCYRLVKYYTPGTPCNRGIPDTNKPTIILIGGTCAHGRNIVDSLVNIGYYVVIASRRESKFLDMYAGVDNVMWIYTDVRIDKSIDDMITRVKATCGRLCTIINLGVLSVPTTLHPICGERNGDDVHLKLQGAYKPDTTANLSLYRRGSLGVESWIFTNIIGTINVIKIAEKHTIHNVIMVNVHNDIMTALLNQLVGENANTRTIMSVVDTPDIENILRLIQPIPH